MARQGCTHIALKGEGVGILNVLVLEVVEVNLGEVSVDGRWVMVTAAGQPVVVHRVGGAAKKTIVNTWLNKIAHKIREKWTED